MWVPTVTMILPVWGEKDYSLAGVEPRSRSAEVLVITTRKREQPPSGSEVVAGPTVRDVCGFGVRRLGNAERLGAITNAFVRTNNPSVLGREPRISFYRLGEFSKDLPIRM
jgi:hypothetical protein